MADGNIPSPGEAYFCHQICPVAVITFVVRKNKPGERTFLPVRPAHGKWHTGLLYAVRPSFGPSKDAGLLAAGNTRKPAVCPCRNVCRPYFSNRLRRPPYLLIQLRPTPSAERHKACPQETFTRPMAAELL